MRYLFLIALCASLVACSSCDDKKADEAKPADPAAAAPANPAAAPVAQQGANPLMAPFLPRQAGEDPNARKPRFQSTERKLFRRLPTPTSNEVPPPPAGDGPAPAANPTPAPQPAH